MGEAKNFLGFITATLHSLPPVPYSESLSRSPDVLGHVRSPSADHEGFRKFPEELFRDVVNRISVRFKPCFLESLGIMFRRKPIPLTARLTVWLPICSKNMIYGDQVLRGCNYLRVGQTCVLQYLSMSLSSNAEPVWALYSAPLWNLDSRYSWPKLLNHSLSIFFKWNPTRALRLRPYMQRFCTSKKSKKPILAQNHTIRHVSQ